VKILKIALDRDKDSCYNYPKQSLLIAKER